jgi:DNA-binding transcriptional ArsR family regulator
VVSYEENALDALGDPTRRAVLRRLRDGGRSVGEIADGMEVSRPAVSQHLKILKAARLVRVHAVGTRRVYAVDTQGIESLRKWLDQFWDETLLAFKEATEREAAKESSGRLKERFERKEPIK